MIHNNHFSRLEPLLQNSQSTHQADRDQNTPQQYQRTISPVPTKVEHHEATVKDWLESPLAQPGLFTTTPNMRDASKQLRVALLKMQAELDKER